MTRRPGFALQSLLLLLCIGLAPPAGAADATRITGPVTQGNLSLYFIHGPSAPGPVPLTLAEALAKGTVTVAETGAVNALIIENSGAEEVFVEAGSIIEGGRQDRVLTVSLLLPAHSGRIPVTVFCVEHGRWSARSGEDAGRFAGAAALIPSHAAKAAIREAALPQSPQARAAAIREGQQRIWSDVARLQRALSQRLGADITAPPSRTSLPLALENAELEKAQAAYVQALAPAGEAGADIVGVAVAIDGRLDSAEVYASNGLFRKMWRPLLAAAVTEALSRPAAAAAAPPPAASVRALLQPAAPPAIVDLAAGARLMTRDGAAGTAFETLPPGGAGFLERSYLAR